MSISPLNLARVSNTLRLSMAQRSLARTQQGLLDAQNQLTTGKRRNAPSDNPADAAVAMQLHKTLEQRQAYATNLQYASSHLAEVDSSVSDLTELLRQAQSVASENVASTVSVDERAAAATVIDSIYNQAVALANRQFQDTYLFAGDRGTAAPYVSELGGIRFVGSDTPLQNRFDDGAALSFMVKPSEIFGDLSTTATLSGAAVGSGLTDLTPLASLRGGLGIDQAGGLVLSNAARTVTLDISGATTVQDLLNAINGAGMGALARINPDGTGIQVINTVQGLTLNVAENGGTTATDLGIRTFSPQTALSRLNGGAGVRTVAGADLRITRRDGTAFDIDLGSQGTIQDVIDAINAADGGGGVTASFSPTGNGIVLADTTGGAGALSVSRLNYSYALEDLGLDASSSGATLTGRDVGGLQATGLFANLKALRDALIHNNQSAITTAADSLGADVDRLTRVRGQVGAQMQAFENRLERLEDQNVATKSLLAGIEDADFNEVIVRFQTLQTSLEANLQTTGKILNLSLMDFLG